MENQANSTQHSDTAAKAQHQPESSSKAGEIEESVQAEIGPEIYDLGQGGPDASSSGLSNQAEDQADQSRQTGSAD